MLAGAVCPSANQCLAFDATCYTVAPNATSCVSTNTGSGGGQICTAAGTACITISSTFTYEGQCDGTGYCVRSSPHAPS